MMNYRIVTHSGAGDVSSVMASIKEIATDSWVATNLHMMEARALAKHLNAGGGFNGITPDFFLVDITSQQD